MPFGNACCQCPARPGTEFGRVRGAIGRAKLETELVDECGWRTGSPPPAPPPPPHSMLAPARRLGLSEFKFVPRGPRPAVFANIDCGGFGGGAAAWPGAPCPSSIVFGHLQASNACMVQRALLETTSADLTVKLHGHIPGAPWP